MTTASVPSPTPTTSTEKTFTSYTPTQGDTYATHRPGYHPKLYNLILSHHTTTGGQLNTILDIGCGPGTAVRALAPNFKNAIGLDPSEGMIATATSLPNVTKDEKENTPIRFAVSTAEDLGWHLDPPIADSSIDLIVAATAAHWFNMSLFWPRAARVLKPGGTVAFWTTGDTKMDSRMPNAARIQAEIDDIEEMELRPFFVEGNLLTRGLYEGLIMPWDLQSGEGERDGVWEKESVVRKKWGPGEGEEDSDEFYEGGKTVFSLDAMEKVVGTTSPVQRWREANKEKVGTEGDVVRLMRRVVERELREASVVEGQEVVKASIRGVLIMVKKRA